MLLTFEIMSKVKGILLQRDAKILMSDSIYAFKSYSGRSRGGAWPPPLIFRPN